MKVGGLQVKVNPGTSKMSPNTYSPFFPSVCLSLSLSVSLSPFLLYVDVLFTFRSQVLTLSQLPQKQNGLCILKERH